MPAYSKSPPVVAQQHAEDRVAIFSQLCSDDLPEGEQLAKLARLTPPDDPRRPIVDWLLRHDDRENRQHVEGLVSERQSARDQEAANRARYADMKKAPSLLVTDPEANAVNHEQCSTPTAQLTLDWEPT